VHTDSNGRVVAHDDQGPVLGLQHPIEAFPESGAGCDQGQRFVQRLAATVNHAGIVSVLLSVIATPSAWSSVRTRCTCIPGGMACRVSSRARWPGRTRPGAPRPGGGPLRHGPDLPGQAQFPEGDEVLMDGPGAMAEATANTTARSAAGSVMLMPRRSHEDLAGAGETNSVRQASTARRSDTREGRCRWRGVGRCHTGLAGAEECLDLDQRGRRPGGRGRPRCRETPSMRSPRRSGPGSGTGRRPSSRISKMPTSPAGPNGA